MRQQPCNANNAHWWTGVYAYSAHQLQMHSVAFSRSTHTYMCTPHVHPEPSPVCICTPQTGPCGVPILHSRWLDFSFRQGTLTNRFIFHSAKRRRRIGNNNRHSVEKCDNPCDDAEPKKPKITHSTKIISAALNIEMLLCFVCHMTYDALHENAGALGLVRSSNVLWRMSTSLCCLRSARIVSN